MSGTGSEEGEPPTEEMLDDLRRVAEELGRPPVPTEYADSGEYSATTLYERHDSWEDVWRAAGLDPAEAPATGARDEDLLDDLQRLAEEHDYPPSYTLVDQKGRYSADTYLHRFGSSWDDVLDTAGIDREEEYTKQRQRTKDEFTAELAHLADELGHPPSPMDMRVDGDKSPENAWMLFDSWDDALDAAGLDTDYTPEVRTDRGREMVADIQRVGDDVTASTYQSEGEFTVRQIKRTFGSWRAALDATGHENGQSSRASRDELAAELRRLTGELGHPPSSSEYDRLGEYSNTTVRKRFGSWDDALEAAGIDE